MATNAAKAAADAGSFFAASGCHRATRYFHLLSTTTAATSTDAGSIFSAISSHRAPFYDDNSTGGKFITRIVATTDAGSILTTGGRERTAINNHFVAFNIQTATDAGTILASCSLDVSAIDGDSIAEVPFMIFYSCTRAYACTILSTSGLDVSAIDDQFADGFLIAIMMCTADTSSIFIFVGDNQTAHVAAIRLRVDVELVVALQLQSAGESERSFVG